MTPDLWIQSLRADSSRPVKAGARPSHSNVAIVDRQASGSRGAKEKRTQPSPNRNKDVSPASQRPKSPKNKRSEATVDPPGKCSNICCNHLSGSLQRPGSQIMSKLRMNEYVDRTRISEQLSRGVALHTSFQKEISRLKRILVACPPPGQNSPSTRRCRTSPTLCKHACCDPSMCPPRASTEMLRLRRIIRQLQIRVRELSQNLHMKRCLLSPIRRLPPELLQMVFLFAIPNRQWFLTVTQSAMDALRLAQVCSYWRTVALDTSKLWTGVLIRASTRHQSSIAHLEFYSSHAKASPLTVHCHKIPGRSFMKKLTSLSHRWSEILLTIGNSPLEELNAVRHKIPLLTSLSLRNLCGRDGTQTNDAFECAPSLRRVVLTINSGNVWPFSYILPWEQVTSLTLVPISQSVFSECIRNCPQLLYFHAIIRARPEELVQPITALPHSPLRKLVLQSLGVLNLDVLRPLSFPHLQSLGIDRILLHPVTGMLQPDLLAFLARSTHLEMLSIRGANVTTADLVVLLLAAPSLRMPHFRDWNTVMVTPKFNVSLVARALDDPFDAAPPQSLAELGVEGCTAYNEVELLRLMKMRAERHPSFDPYGIETARLCIEHVPFDGEAELDYLSHRY